jgi:HAMP domain-containing protein
LAALLSIYLATYFATAIVVYSGVRASILDSDAAALNQLAALKYEQLANVVGALATDLTAWSELEVMNDIVSGDIDMRVAQTLEGLKRLYGLTGDIYAFDAAGKLLASSRGGRPSGVRERIPAQWQNSERTLVFVDKETDPMRGEEIVALEVPVFGSFDRTYRIGTLVLTYPWSSIEKLVFSPENGTILLEKGETTRVLTANPPDIGERAGFDRARILDGRAGTGFVVGRSPPGSGLLGRWEVLMLQDYPAATRLVHRVALKLMLLGAFLGLPIILLGRWLSHRLTAPIADLTRVVREIADTEKLDARVPITSSDELGSLARSFNRMTESLERTTREATAVAWRRTSRRVVLNFGERSTNVAVAFEDVDHLQPVLDVSEEDHVTFTGDAPDVRAKLGSRPTEDTGLARQLAAALPQQAHEAVGDSQAATRPGDIGQDPHQVGLDRGEEDESPHSATPFCRNRAAAAASASSSSALLTSPPVTIEPSIVALSALSLASRSSTRRRPSRTTSLADP